jgi:predicted signal transduction protein with EAL and GGDEF domain
LQPVGFGFADSGFGGFGDTYINPQFEASPIIVGKFAVRVAISAGVALRDDDQTFDRLYSEADRALYQAKAAGRNRIQFASPSQLPSALAARIEPLGREGIARRA